MKTVKQIMNDAIMAVRVNDPVEFSNYMLKASSSFKDIYSLPPELQFEALSMFRRYILENSDITYAIQQSNPDFYRVGDVATISSIYVPDAEDDEGFEDWAARTQRWLMNVVRWSDIGRSTICLWRGMKKGPAVLMQKITAEDILNMLKPILEEHYQDFFSNYNTPQKSPQNESYLAWVHLITLAQKDPDLVKEFLKAYFKKLQEPGELQYIAL